MPDKCLNVLLTNSSSSKRKLCTESENNDEKRSKEDITSLSHNEDVFDDDCAIEFATSSMNINVLDLTDCQYCKVVDISNVIGKKIITVSNKRNATAQCEVSGFWSHTKMNIGDKLHICAVKNPSISQQWTVTNEKGYIIYKPDFLISSTTVVNSVFCKRRTVLSQRFPSLDPPNRYMLIGVVIHHLLQTVLKNNERQIEQIDKILRDLLNSNKIMRKFFECNVRLADVEMELKEFPVAIAEFMKSYVKVEEQRNCDKRIGAWHGQIQRILDIEENVWCPQLGVKGKIDVTIANQLNQTLPLEVKTGKNTVSMEHRGQVILYLMMMQKLGYQVFSGLLLYLRDLSVREITATSHEQRDLIILRNDLAYYLTRNVQIVNKDSISPLALPPPINHTKACQKCPFNTICVTYLKEENYDFQQNAALQQVNISHLNSNHLRYFVRWTALLHLEGQSVKIGAKNVSDIYTVPAVDRQLTGKCLINMHVVNVTGTDEGELFDHVFALEKNPASAVVSVTLSEFHVGSYVVISTDARPAVSTGFVISITSTTITLTSDSNLLLKYTKNTRFHLDVYDSNKTEAYNLSSLALLVEDTSRSKKLRELLIDLVAPKYRLKLSADVINKCASAGSILRRLNRCQQRAVLRALSTDDYLLIHGMPGTGKTETIVALIQLLVALKRTVLITSHTHTAVDNICVKLNKFDVDYLRLGAENRIHTEVYPKSEAFRTQDCCNLEQLEAMYEQVKVVAVTCLASAHPLVVRKTWDVCIVDESTQVLQTAVLRPLLSSTTFVLVGDPKQLPPVVRNKTSLKHELSVSLFEHLHAHHPEAQTILTENYRMNKCITQLASSFSYDNQLNVADNFNVSNSGFKIGECVDECDPWFTEVLSTDLDKSIQFINTGAVHELSVDLTWLLNGQKLRVSNICDTDERLSANIYESVCIVRLLRILIASGVAMSDIGVIATYRVQVVQLEYLLNKTATSVEISTVDQFQGRDKSVIIYSCSLSKDLSKDCQSENYILNDQRRLNVAITRAKQKLVFVGDVATLKHFSCFQRLFELIDENCIIHLNSFPTFNWNALASSLYCSN